MPEPLPLSSLNSSAINWLALASTIWWIASILVHAAFAVAVAKHARGRSTELVPAWLWIVSTLLFGPLVAIGYWFFHSKAAASLAEPARRARTEAHIG